ncbi:hypothetical protein M5K25_019761 [Dendrobium thyrsiflorum]|uniref:Uncharacterized protein n=1 Tax=Dendrobium thyrsiflorum TaxID=117978 RepID=A0ABD0UMR6_DENTH
MEVQKSLWVGIARQGRGQNRIRAGPAHWRSRGAKAPIWLMTCTAKIQILKKAGRPSERLVSHEHCRFSDTAKHECLHVREITEEDGTEDAEADAEYESSLKEAIRGVQDAVTSINEHLEEVRYEIEALSPTSFCASVI